METGAGLWYQATDCGGHKDIKIDIWPKMLHILTAMRKEPFCKPSGDMIMRGCILYYHARHKCPYRRKP